MSKVNTNGSTLTQMEQLTEENAALRDIIDGMNQHSKAMEYALKDKELHIIQLESTLHRMARCLGGIICTQL